MIHAHHALNIVVKESNRRKIQFISETNPDYILALTLRNKEINRLSKAKTGSLNMNNSVITL